MMGELILRQGLLFLLCTVLFAGNAHGAFITDKIMVEVRSERFGQGSLLKSIPSGSSVEVLIADGKYSRIRTTDNITGWVNSTFLTHKKPSQLEYLELLSQSKITEKKLRAAERALTASPATVDTATAGINAKEISRLKKQAKDARWMKVEMMKARDRAEQAEAKLKIALKRQRTKNTQGDKNQQQLKDLQNHNQALQQRLAAALLVSEPNAIAATTTLSTTNATTNMKADDDLSTTMASQVQQSNDDGNTLMPWFFAGLLVSLVLGFVTGVSWLDKRNRQRHGGFRL
jgi:SH3 domain protein